MTSICKQCGEDCDCKIKLRDIAPKRDKDALSGFVQRYSWADRKMPKASENEVIERLREQLQNCVNHLTRLKRHGNASAAHEVDEAIDAANRALYETFNLSLTGE